MQRIVASAVAVSWVGACTVLLLIASNISAASQVLDPGWQLVYAGQPGYGGNGGLLQSMFDGGTGQEVIARAYEGGPQYDQPVQEPYRPAPAYYPPAAQPAPVYSRQILAPQAPGSAPQYTGTVPAQQVRSFQTAPVNYPEPAPVTHQAAAPPQGAYQPALQYPQQGAPQPFVQYSQPAPQRLAFGYVTPPPAYAPSSSGDMAQPIIDPRYERQVVDYQGHEPPGTIIVDTPHFFLYLVLEGGKALRYGIGVGRPGFTWAGVKEISAMREWPDWVPPPEMLERRPDLPRYMPGGADNPLGARALYLGSTLYRIHGSNEPWSIGTQVSSGCIRLRNADIIDLYSRVKVGTRVIVI